MTVTNEQQQTEVPEATPVTGPLSHTDAMAVLAERRKAASSASENASGDEAGGLEDGEKVSDASASDDVDGENEASEEGGEASQGEETPPGADADKGDEGKSSDLGDLPDDGTVTISGASYKVSDLKAMHQREVGLQAEHAKVAQQRTQMEHVQAVFSEALKRQMEDAQARFDEYAGQDHAAVKAHFEAQGNPQAYDQYVAGMQAAYEEATKAKETYESLSSTVSKAAEARHAEAISRMSKELLDPNTGIPGYDQARHSKNADFAAKMGLDADTLSGLTMSSAWRVIDMARRFGEASEVANAAKEKPQAGSAKPTMRTTAKPSAQSGKAASEEKARSQLASSGSHQDALALLQARRAAASRR